MVGGIVEMVKGSNRKGNGGGRRKGERGGVEEGKGRVWGTD